MTLTLIVQNAGTLPGAPMPPYRTDGDMIAIGRSPDCDWHLPDPTDAISSRHCELRRDGDAWLLTDTSTTGTYLNGAAERMTGAHRLAEGDVIRIGHYEILASLAKPAAPAALDAATVEGLFAALIAAAQLGGAQIERSDAFLDLQSHQVAILKAIPGALRATLDRFSPGSIQRRRSGDLGLLAKLLPTFRDAALWRHYEREFAAVTEESDEAFMEVFAREFRKAYERELGERSGG